MRKTPTKKIVYHAGDFKTGTSSLQDHLWANRQSLQRAGLTYLSCDGRKSHLDLAIALRRKKHEDANVIAAAEKEISEDGNSLFVASSEVFQESFLSGARPLFEKSSSNSSNSSNSIQTSIVYYVRPHLDAYVARYLQRLKLCKPVGTPGAFFTAAKADRLFNYKDRIESFCNIVGRENVTVRPFGSKFSQMPDVVTDFFVNVLERPHLLELGESVERTNVTPGPRSIQAMLYTEAVLRLEGYQELWRFNEAALARLLNHYISKLSESKTAYSIPSPLLAELQSEYAGDASFLDEFIGLEEGFSSALLGGGWENGFPLQDFFDGTPSADVTELVAATLAAQTIFPRDSLVTSSFA